MNKNDKLINRDNERKMFRENILRPIPSESRLILVDGDSGTGKTYFIKSVLNEILEENPNYYCCYLDISNDELNALSLFEILTFYSWNPQNNPTARKSLLQIPENISYKKFLKKLKYKKTAKNRIISTINKSLSIIPVYGSILSEVIPANFQSQSFDSSEITNLFFEYLVKITKKNKAVIVIDNYQFVNEPLRIKIEALAEEIKNNFYFVILNRTNNGVSDIRPLLCFSNYQIHLNMNSFDTDSTKTLVNYKLNNILPDKIDDIYERIYQVTNGNPKLIEFITNQYLFNINQNILTNDNLMELSEAINSLPDIERYILMISSFFPSGLKTRYLTDIIQKIIAYNDTKDLKSGLKILVSLGYIIINSTQGDLIKPTHEKIISTTKNIVNTEEYSDIYYSIINSLESIINDNSMTHDDKEYDYMLYCLISMYSSNQLKNKTSYIMKLIDRFYHSFLYSYITSFYQGLKDILYIFPETIILKLLDTFQKTSMFYEGLEVIGVLKSENVFSETIKIYYAKFLTQTYDFNNALDILNQLPDDISVILYKMNILQHLGKDDEAIYLMEKALKTYSPDTDEYQIILRNTTHFFSFNEAIINLMGAFKYFDEKNAIFPLATVYNNLAVVYIWANDLSNADKYLEKSTALFKEINSNELFESLFNHSVLLTLQGKYADAEEKANEAMFTLPKVLWMDVLVLKLNTVIIQFLGKKLSIPDAYNEILNLYAKAKKASDPWVKYIVLFNLNTIENILDKNYTETVEQKIIQQIYSAERTRFDVILSIEHNDKKCDFLLALSPNWRY